MASGAAAAASPAARFKARLASGAAVAVVNVDHPSPSLVEALGRLGVDAVFFDCEQGAPDFERVEDMARAARLTGTASVVRLYQPADWLIERVLFRRVDGIVVPRVDRAEDARRVVAAVRYCYPADHGEKIVAVQVETAAALADLDALAAVEGVDALFVGPVDLAKSLGHGGDWRGPEMRRVIEQTVRRIADAGRPPGILVDPDDVAGWRALGVRFLYVHADAILAAGWRAFRDRMGGTGAG